MELLSIWCKCVKIDYFVQEPTLRFYFHITNIFIVRLNACQCGSRYCYLCIYIYLFIIITYIFMAPIKNPQNGKNILL